MLGDIGIVVEGNPLEGVATINLGKGVVLLVYEGAELQGPHWRLSSKRRGWGAEDGEYGVEC